MGRDGRPPVGSQPSRTLLVILRGHVRALGVTHQFSKATDASEAALQAHRAALGSLRSKVLEPAERSGWQLEVVAHLVAPAEAAVAVEAVGRAALGSRLGAHALTRLQPSQSRTTVAAITFALDAAKAPPHTWGAILLVRSDLIWKAAISLPSPWMARDDGGSAHGLGSPASAGSDDTRGSDMGVLWRVDEAGGGGGCQGALADVPWVNDVLIHLPAHRLTELWTFLTWNRERHQSGRNLGLHLLAHSPGFGREAGIGVDGTSREHRDAPGAADFGRMHGLSGGLRFLYPCSYNANPEKERNPIYTIVGRTESAPSPDCTQAGFTLAEVGNRLRVHASSLVQTNGTGCRFVTWLQRGDTDGGGGGYARDGKVAAPPVNATLKILSVGGALLPGQGLSSRHGRAPRHVLLVWNGTVVLEGGFRFTNPSHRAHSPRYAPFDTSVARSTDGEVVNRQQLRYAVLVRGTPFMWGCGPMSSFLQRLCLHSMVKQIAAPLIARGHAVEIFLALSYAQGSCAETLLAAMLNETSGDAQQLTALVRSTWRMSGATQAVNMRLMLARLLNHAHAANKAYDFVILSRCDTRYLTPIVGWRESVTAPACHDPASPAVATRLAFASRTSAHSWQYKIRGEPLHPLCGAILLDAIIVSTRLHALFR